ncbi:BA14K family protein [Bauldia sp.]|uniref:BA14K family protein n=1 Tax=Bauldia sp. TaxID=2575872 RepID=UPI003BA91B94
MKSIVATIAIAGLLGLGVTSASAKDPYCDAYAKDYARDATGGNIVGGAAVGGIGGAVLGGILGKKKKGVTTGAIAGAVGGGALGAATRNRAYNQAYAECVANKANYAQPVGAPPVGSNAWKQMCSQKYKSFNWNTGYYLGYDGDYHLCKIP